MTALPNAEPDRATVSRMRPVARPVMPEKNPHALLFSELTYQQVREQNLRVMDATAISQCMEHGMPILVFNYRRDGNIERAVAGERIGTLISSRRD